jgi:hypothetical protein
MGSPRVPADVADAPSGPDILIWRYYVAIP